eukprot:418598_1
MSSITDKIDKLIQLTEEKSEFKQEIKNAFVIVTKWPTKGKSKTRLSKSIGSDFAIEFSFCALKDLLLYYSQLPHTKFVLFAPKDNKPKFESLLKQLQLTAKYHLIPMIDSNMKTSNLGNKLSGCIQDIQSNSYNINGSICFIGSDCLELRIKNIITANNYTHSNKNNAYIIPANDGGYVMIDLPPNVSPKVFDNVLWSHEKTCESQIASIQKCGINVIKSDLILADVDDIQDWFRLCNNFGILWEKQMDDNKNCIDNEMSIDYNKCFANVSALLKQHKVLRPKNIT